MSMQIPYFFGYGSLVNRATHTYPNATRAKASGWRRMWRHTGKRPVAFLTVVPDTSGTIEGLIAAVPDADWAALDEREWAYDRIGASKAVTHTLDHQPDVAIYAVLNDLHHTPSRKHPILLSYIDVVVQGYLTEFGKDGAERFFQSTDGWDAPIIDDRVAPMYPRHQTLTSGQRGFVDDQLEMLSARIETPEQSCLSLKRF